MKLLLSIALLLNVSSGDVTESEPSDASVSEIVAAPEPPPGVWDKLAQCEATGNWRAVSPGGRYRGGIQADAIFWARYGGLEFAPRADLASRAQQIIVAERGLAVQGWIAWPVCSRVIGVR